ncbi:MAG TPA: hypothetical protein VHM24_05895, partial [Gemmatimonadaceae bacterium]|nr:hypothetical protein [Gemmatimonadaceae bacterium]
MLKDPEALGATLLRGAPGQTVARVRFMAMGRDGSPINNAVVRWIPTGRGAAVRNASRATNHAGELTAEWVLGTDAGEEQGLNVSVTTWGGASKQIALRATAIPTHVAELHFAAETLALKLGRDSAARFFARDDFGNEFVPDSVEFLSSDISVAAITTGGRISSHRRGQAVAIARVGRHV